MPRPYEQPNKRPTSAPVRSRSKGGESNRVSGRQFNNGPAKGPKGSKGSKPKEAPKPRSGGGRSQGFGVERQLLNGIGSIPGRLAGGSQGFGWERYLGRQIGGNDRQVNADGVLALADFARRRAAEQGGGAMSGIGGAMNRLTSGLGSAIERATGGGTTFDNLLAQIMGGQTAPPSAPTMSPSLVDVNSVVAPFAGYREQTQKQYDQNRTRLGELAASNNADVEAVKAATQHRLADLEHMRQADAARNLGAIQNQGAATAASQAALGFEPAAMGGGADTAARAAQDVQMAANSEASRIADMRSSADIEATRRATFLSGANTGAGQELDRNLFAAMSQLQQQEAAARMQAEQANAQSMQQAAGANYDAQMADYNNRIAATDSAAQLPGALAEAGQMLGAFSYPQRASVQQQLSGGPADSLRSVLLNVLNDNANPDDALVTAMQTVTDYNKKYKTDWQVPQLRQWINDWYAQDGTMSNTGFNRLGQLFGRGF